MKNYRRVYEKGGWYFFTVVTYKRMNILTLPENTERLRQGFKHVMKKHPFEIDAMVVLPDHLHCIWIMPKNDHDFSTRWRLIKRYLSIGQVGSDKKGRKKKLWQDRFWEHLIRDENDWRQHFDYIHYNPVKHGYVHTVAEWKQSSFSRAVTQGYYDRNWGLRDVPQNIKEMCFE